MPQIGRPAAIYHNHYQPPTTTYKHRNGRRPPQSPDVAAAIVANAIATTVFATKQWQTPIFSRELPQRPVNDKFLFQKLPVFSRTPTLQPMKKLKAVIFDLDGTLANTLPLCIAAFRKSIEPLISRSVSDQEIIAGFGPSEEGTIMALAPAHYQQGIADYLYYYDQLHSSCPAPFEGIRELLQNLQDRGIRLAMVTGKGKHSTAISLRYFDLASFFEIIETGSPNGPRKAGAYNGWWKTLPAYKKKKCCI